MRQLNNLFQGLLSRPTTVTLSSSEHIEALAQKLHEHQAQVLESPTHPEPALALRTILAEITCEGNKITIKLP